MLNLSLSGHDPRADIRPSIELCDPVDTTILIVVWFLASAFETGVDKWPPPLGDANLQRRSPGMAALRAGDGPLAPTARRTKMVRLVLLLLAADMTLGLQPMVAFADELPTYDVRATWTISPSKWTLPITGSLLAHPRFQYSRN